MTESAEPGDGIQLRALSEQIQDLTRVIARQSQIIDRLATDATQTGPRTDTPLLVELFALFTDADTCARTADSDRDAAAFAALRDGLERLIVGRDGRVVIPCAGDDFDVAVMEAADVRAASDTAAAGTVAELIRPGLVVAGRSVRPAMVVAYRG
ncbi:nucleotide exchange factor GrpE [Gordonia bronchialis]|uniref:nucleotide exchange factor GrpE n=1 Tax=Gordonia bronchialis TaxID=2054 RepID=UPI00242C721A|nr:nucleotide exchange factor GrpE [Gordonia bronchialis]